MPKDATQIFFAEDQTVILRVFSGIIVVIDVGCII